MFEAPEIQQVLCCWRVGIQPPGSRSRLNDEPLSFISPVLCSLLLLCLTEEEEEERGIKVVHRERKNSEIYCEEKAASSELTKQIQYCSMRPLILRVAGERGDNTDKSKSTWQPRFAVLICLLCARHQGVLRAAALKFYNTTKKSSTPGDKLGVWPSLLRLHDGWIVFPGQRRLLFSRQEASVPD